MAGYIGSKASVVSSGAERKKTFTITGATTSLTGLNYTVGKVHVFQNGVRLVDGTDYTATNSTTITLTVAAQSGDNVVVISQAAFQVADALLTSGGTMTGDLTVQGAFTSPGIDDNGNATAMTIDSNENVLITKTATGIATVGSELKATGELLATVNNDACAFLNRKSSDGDIINLRKDGSTVGGIGVSGTRLTVGSGGSASGIRFDGAQWIPTISNVASDNGVDIGWSTSRIRNIYTSGGIYLGGTGSANKLDDYEEGSFTPTLHGGFSSGPTSYSRQVGVYVKVGRLVSFQIDIKAIGASANNSLIQLGGLPFTSVQNATNGYGAAYISYQESFVSGNYPQLHVSADSTLIQFYQNGGGSAVNYNGNASDTNINARLIIVGQYLTDA